MWCRSRVFGFDGTWWVCKGICQFLVIVECVGVGSACTWIKFVEIESVECPHPAECSVDLVVVPRTLAQLHPCVVNRHPL